MTDVGFIDSSSSTPLAHTRLGWPCSHFLASSRRLCLLLLLASLALSSHWSIAAWVVLGLLAPARLVSLGWCWLPLRSLRLWVSLSTRRSVSVPLRVAGGGWAGSEQRQLGSFAQSLARPEYIQRLDTTPVYTTQHYSAQEAAKTNRREALFTRALFYSFFNWWHRSLLVRASKCTQVWTSADVCHTCTMLGC